MKTSPAKFDEKRLIALLKKFPCPTPYHAIRTRFLGCIASPNSASPVEAVKALWGGEFPPAKSIDDLNELLGALVMGLWNDLTRYQEPRTHFKFVPCVFEPTREALQKYARTRHEELDGFAEGLFGGRKKVNLTPAASEQLDQIAEIGGHFHGAQRLFENEAIETPEKELSQTIKSLKMISDIAEKEISALVQACARTRRRAK